MRSSMKCAIFWQASIAWAIRAPDEPCYFPAVSLQPDDLSGSLNTTHVYYDCHLASVAPFHTGRAPHAFLPTHPVPTFCAGTAAPTSYTLPARAYSILLNNRK